MKHTHQIGLKKGRTQRGHENLQAGTPKDFEKKSLQGATFKYHICIRLSYD